LRLARAMALLMSVVISGLGALAVVTRYYYGRSSRWGTEVTLYDGPAVWAGIGLIAIGLIPMGLWFGSARKAAAWMVGCALLLVATLVLGRS